MKRFAITALPLNKKKVLVRTDFNVTLKRGKVTDESKVKAVVPTLRFLLAKECQIVVCSHLARPKEKEKKYSLKPIADLLQDLMPEATIVFVDDALGNGVFEEEKHPEKNKIIVLENLRFHKQEKENNLVFAQRLANYAQYYINDAFSITHREHASITGVPSLIPAAGGFNLEKELEMLNQIHEHHKKPVWIFGGAKLDKLHLLDDMLANAKAVLIGGALAFSFLRAQGYRVGMSKIDHKLVEKAKKLLKSKHKDKIILPVDVVCAQSLLPQEQGRTCAVTNIRENEMGLDIGPQSIALFKKHLERASMVVWNGPVGLFEHKAFARATHEIGLFLGHLDCFKVAGGTQTLEVIHKYHLQHHFDHLSLGGGAMLAYLAGESLPGITALEASYKKFRKQVKKESKNILAQLQ